MFKRFKNLLYDVFTETCSLFKAMLEVIRAPKEYLPEARKQMTFSTKGSICWISSLQSRQFVIGEVNLLCEFTTIHEVL